MAATRGLSKSGAKAKSKSKSKSKSARSKKSTKGTSSSSKRASKSASASKSAPKKRGSGKRDLLKTPTGNFFAHRDGEGQFTEMDEVGRSLAADRRKKAKTKVASGYGDRGDR